MAVTRIDVLPRLVLQTAQILGNASVTFTDSWIDTVRFLPDNLRAIDDAAATARTAAPSRRRVGEIDALVAELRRVATEAVRGVTVTGPAGRAVVTLPVAGSPVGAATPEPERDRVMRLECQWQRDELPDVIRELVLEDQERRNDICWSVFT